MNPPSIGVIRFVLLLALLFCWVDAFAGPGLMGKEKKNYSSCCSSNSCMLGRKKSHDMRSFTMLFGSGAGSPRSNNDRVKKAGGGVPVIASGDRDSFWDPASEGMRGMEGDFSLEERLAMGKDFDFEGSVNGGYGYPANANANANANAYAYAYANPNLTNLAVPEMLHAAQCWLEDSVSSSSSKTSPVPPPFCTAKSPVTATVLGRTPLIESDAPGDIQHIVLRLPEGFRYVEGQSISVIPPGTDPSTGRPHKPRLYSIASTRYGDLLDGTTVSLCVRRAEYTDPATGKVDPSKAGVCSGFLCDAVPGQKVSVAGPVGKTMLLPAFDSDNDSDSDKDAHSGSVDLIMVATGTGIAPFRSFLHRLFTEHTPANHMFKGNGKAWLILGVPTSGSLLYKPEFDAMLRTANQNPTPIPSHEWTSVQVPEPTPSLRIDYAISREMTNASGGKLYVQDVLRENAGELMERLENGAVIYFCGLRGMMPGILEALEEVATASGMDWAETLKKYKANHQWHVEVY
ncbi:unnamed protein product [Pseudo-nitzschia multistriata]|uniref:ferredoxin--NADP(+) reductase n=1 Tax=Pseudo-nitzschia multistriata TaxID=183589 RepID=A0A448ZQR3_9STRA|nr:unnamed protein product [Pseudo-nitzschia multistriata]